MSLVYLTRIEYNKYTDKNTTHSYLPLYEEILSPIKDTAKNVLEVGIWYGGSLKLWYDYFTNSKIYGIDLIDYKKEKIKIKFEDIKNSNRVEIMDSTNAYDKQMFKKNFLDKNIKFDFMIDDGPHDLKSMKSFIKLYSQIMTENGILIIEDISNLDWIKELTNVTPDNLKKYIKSYDLRKNKNRHDDIVFVINKNILK